MSTTETTTQTENGAPELTFVHRVTAIPLINASWETIDGALSTHFLTRSPYALGKGLSYSALKLTEPVQKRLAPLIVQADGLANKSLDLVQARYPYPFEAKPEDVKNLVKERRQSATEYANKTIDERVKSPAYNVATGIDQSFAPIVDYFEVAVNKYNSNSSEGAGPSTPPDAKYQYQRALSLSRDLLRQAHAQSLLVQRATETAHSISTLASSSVNNASTRFHNLSNNMSTELAKLQQSTASLSTDLRNTFQQSLESIPSYDKIQESYAEFSEQLSAASKEVGNIVKNKDLPVQEKINKMANEITDRVTPLLDRIRRGLSELIAKGKETAEVAQQHSGEPKQNGNGAHHEEQNGEARGVEDEKSE